MGPQMIVEQKSTAEHGTNFIANEAQKSTKPWENPTRHDKHRRRLARAVYLSKRIYILAGAVLSEKGNC